MDLAYRLGRRLVIAVTALSLLAASGLPAPAPAAERAPAVAAAAAAQNRVTLEQAIQIAKKAYPDVGRFGEFSSDYNEYEGRGSGSCGGAARGSRACRAK